MPGKPRTKTPKNGEATEPAEKPELTVTDYDSRGEAVDVPAKRTGDQPTLPGIPAPRELWPRYDGYRVTEVALAFAGIADLTQNPELAAALAMGNRFELVISGEIVGRAHKFNTTKKGEARTLHGTATIAVEKRGGVRAVRETPITKSGVTVVFSDETSSKSVEAVELVLDDNTFRTASDAPNIAQHPCARCGHFVVAHGAGIAPSEGYPGRPCFATDNAPDVRCACRNYRSALDLGAESALADLCDRCFHRRGVHSAAGPTQYCNTGHCDCSGFFDAPLDGTELRDFAGQDEAPPKRQPRRRAEAAAAAVLDDPDPALDELAESGGPDRSELAQAAADVAEEAPPSVLDESLAIALEEAPDAVESDEPTIEDGGRTADDDAEEAELAERTAAEAPDDDDPFGPIR